MIDGVANMTIGSYNMYPERSALMTASCVYIFSAFRFAFIRSMEHSTPLSRLLAPFQGLLWISILSLVSISIIIVLLTKKLPRGLRHFIIGGRVNRTPIINMINGIVANVVANPRMAQRRYFGVFARALTINWLFYWLIVRNAYLGALYDSLKSQPATSLYDTVEKVQQSDCNIHIFSSTMKFVSDDFGIERYSSYLKVKKMNFFLNFVINMFYQNYNRFRTNEYELFDALQKLSSGEWKGVVFTNEIVVQYFKLVTKAHQMDFTRDVLRQQTSVFYFQKNSILTDMFNRKIGICQETGLMQYWLARFSRIKEGKRSKYRPPSKLSLTNIMAVLKISAILYIVSVIVFVLEIISPNYICIKRFLDYLTY